MGIYKLSIHHLRYTTANIPGNFDAPRCEAQMQMQMHKQISMIREDSGMSINRTLMAMGLTALGIFHVAPAISNDLLPADLAKGKYLVELGGCNDCHTAGYAPSAGQVPVQNWLQGDSLGYRGPWGTTYATNLRQFIQNFNEAQWLAYAKAVKTRPPMPWWTLNAMTNDDLTAVYRFIKSLGPSAATVPAYIPPEQKTKAPYIQWPEPPK